MTDYKQLRDALEQAAHELDVAENALLCSSYHNAAQRAKQAAHAARAALAEADKQEERPNRLRKGDMWEFWTEVRVKGKQKPVEKLLQWEVIGWHHGEQAWELLSLDGEHKEYLMEFAPSYEDMRFLGVKSQ